MHLLSISGPIPTRRLLFWTGVTVACVFLLTLLLELFRAGDSWRMGLSVAAFMAIGSGVVMGFFFLVLNVIASNQDRDARVRVFQASHRRFLLMFLGTFATGSLMFTTWAMVRISSWIVFHDSVEYQITDKIDGFLVEAFFIGHGGSILIAEGICGIVFLGLLWHTLYRSEKNESSHDAA